MIALLRALTGLIGWAVAFSLLYGLQGLVCSPRATNWVSVLRYESRLTLVLAWLFCLAALAWACWLLWRRRPRDTLLEWMAPILAVTGLAATAFTGFPVVYATTCT